jgi:hypothetical protein
MEPTQSRFQLNGAGHRAVSFQARKGGLNQLGDLLPITDDAGR